jgi:hypothetical protein
VTKTAGAVGAVMTVNRYGPAMLPYPIKAVKTVNDC